MTAGRNLAMDEGEIGALLARYSRREVSLMDVRRTLRITFADVLIELANRNLPLPRAPQAGREDRIAEARRLLFPSPAR